MAHWLVKSEPDAFSWDQQVANGVEPWTGVRNALAANNLRAMKVGDRAFFYHSNIGKEIVGIVEVVREAYPDPTDETGRWVCVDMKAVRPVPKPVAGPSPMHRSTCCREPGASRSTALPSTVSGSAVWWPTRRFSSVESGRR